MVKTEGKYVTRQYWLSTKFRREVCKKLFTNMYLKFFLCLVLRQPWTWNPGCVKWIVQSSSMLVYKGVRKRVMCARVTATLLKMPKGWLYIKISKMRNTCTGPHIHETNSHPLNCKADSSKDPETHFHSYWMPNTIARTSTGPFNTKKV